MLKELNKNIKILPYLPIYALASIYGLGIFVIGLLAVYPLNKNLEYFVYIVFGFTKEIMPLHKNFGLYDDYFFLGQWPNTAGLVLDVSAIFLIVFILNFSFLRFISVLKKGH